MPARSLFTCVLHACLGSVVLAQLLVTNAPCSPQLWDFETMSSGRYVDHGVSGTNNPMEKVNAVSQYPKGYAPIFPRLPHARSSLTARLCLCVQLPVWPVCESDILQPETAFTVRLRLGAR